MRGTKDTPGVLKALEEFEADVVRGLVERLRLETLLHRFPPRLVWAGFTFVGGFFTIGLLAALAMVSGTPFVFPSLGPTAFLLFFHPRMPIASPRNALFGHAVGILCGAAALLVTGLGFEPSVLSEGMTGRRVLAAALALAATGAGMILLRVTHPPAGATTLIVALGIVARPFHLVIIEVAVGLLVLQAIAINRLAGLDFPLWWKPPQPPAGPPG
jgi:CBS-domain-containing membrane protein